ncbi:MAG: hypothetical protein ACRDZO_21075 [Egibacteraceae bacterium]
MRDGALMEAALCWLCRSMTPLSATRPMGLMHWQPDPVASLCWAQVGSSPGTLRACDALAKTDIGLCGRHYMELFGREPSPA